MAHWQKRAVTVAVLLGGYAAVTFVLANVASFLDSPTTGPMTVGDAWVLLAILLVGLPIGGYLAAELVWFERRRRSRTPMGRAVVPTTARPEVG